MSMMYQEEAAISAHIAQGGVPRGKGFEEFDPRGRYHREIRDKHPETADILMFIGRFMHDGVRVREQVVECFTQGCCYWFARILAERFGDEYGAEIMTDYVIGHFGTRIRGRVYDITGDVTDSYTWEPWSACEDEAQKKRITEYCIMF